jgi:hypothetical protein
VVGVGASKTSSTQRAPTPLRNAPVLPSSNEGSCNRESFFKPMRVFFITYHTDSIVQHYFNSIFQQTNNVFLS